MDSAAYGIWSLIAQSDFVAKFVLITLFFMSVITWAIALYKTIVLRVKMHQCKQIIKELRLAVSVPDIALIAQKWAKTEPGYFMVTVLSHAKQAKEDQSFDTVQMYIDQALDEVMYEQESYTPVLAIFSAVATLLGLLGTVWGLVHSFLSISEKQSADIVTVAPGIAEALITTVAGLLVAIPSLVFLHYVSLKVRDIERLFVAISDKIMHSVRATYAKPVQKTYVDSSYQNYDRPTL